MNNFDKYLRFFLPLQKIIIIIVILVIERLNIFQRAYSSKESVVVPDLERNFNHRTWHRQTPDFGLRLHFTINISITSKDAPSVGAKS